MLTLRITYLQPLVPDYRKPYWSHSGSSKKGLTEATDVNKVLVNILTVEDLFNPAPAGSKDGRLFREQFNFPPSVWGG